MTTKIKVTSTNLPDAENLTLLAKMIFDRINEAPKLAVVENKQPKQAQKSG